MSAILSGKVEPFASLHGCYAASLGLRMPPQNTMDETTNPAAMPMDPAAEPAAPETEAAPTEEAAA